MPVTTATCPRCSYQNSNFDNNCRNCGTALTQGPIPNYGGLQPTVKPPGAEKRIAAGLCGILLGGFGVHKFILGYTTEGIVMVVVYILGIFLACGIPSLVIAIIGIIEGIMYLTKSDEEFSQTYILGRKGWF
jgi:TM2 domain-containing membrane protein YozV